VCACVCFVCMYVYVYTWIVFCIVYACKVVSGLLGDWIKLLLTYLLTYVILGVQEEISNIEASGLTGCHVKLDRLASCSSVNVSGNSNKHKQIQYSKNLSFNQSVEISQIIDNTDLHGNSTFSPSKKLRKRRHLQFRMYHCHSYVVLNVNIFHFHVNETQ